MGWPNLGKAIAAARAMLPSPTSAGGVLVFAYVVKLWGSWNGSHTKTMLPTCKSVPKRRPPDYRREMQTAVVWTCLQFIRSDQNHLARHSERRKKTRQTEERGGKTTSGNGQAWSSPGQRGQRRTEENGGGVICGAPTTLAVEE